MGTRIAVMSKAKLQQVGAPQNLYDRPVNKFVAGFIGSPAMNFVEATVGSSGLQMSGFSIPVPAAFKGLGSESGRSVTVGFRPEHLDLGTASSNVASIAATADVVEYLGNEELIHASVGDNDIVAIVSASHRVRPGDALNLVLPLDKVHIFEPGDHGVSLAGGSAG